METPIVRKGDEWGLRDRKKNARAASEGKKLQKEGARRGKEELIRKRGYRRGVRGGPSRKLLS